MILLNKTSRAVLFGGNLLIPLKPTTVDGKLSDVKKRIPGLPPCWIVATSKR